MNASDQNAACDCHEILQLVLDGQATIEEQQRLREHLQQCPQCLHNYEVESAVVQLLKQKCCGGPEPDDLLARVKAQLNLRS